jgi:hypothetical protein
LFLSLGNFWEVQNHMNKNYLLFPWSQKYYQIYSRMGGLQNKFLGQYFPFFSLFRGCASFRSLFYRPSLFVYRHRTRYIMSRANRGIFYWIINFTGGRFWWF